MYVSSLWGWIIWPCFSALLLGTKFCNLLFRIALLVAWHEYGQINSWNFLSTAILCFQFLSRSFKVLNCVLTMEILHKLRWKTCSDSWWSVGSNSRPSQPNAPTKLWCTQCPNNAIIERRWREQPTNDVPNRYVYWAVLHIAIPTVDNLKERGCGIVEVNCLLLQQQRRRCRPYSPSLQLPITVWNYLTSKYYITWSNKGSLPAQVEEWTYKRGKKLGSKIWPLLPSVSPSVHVTNDSYWLLLINS